MPSTRPIAPPDKPSEEIRAPLPSLLGEVKELVIGELFERLAREGHPGLRWGHGCVFRFIDAGGSRLTELAERALMTKQAVGEVVADLERLGYVERAPDPSDRRAKTIRLTEQGLGAQLAALRIFADIERRLAAEHGSERVADMRRVLEEIAAGAG